MEDSGSLVCISSRTERSWVHKNCSKGVKFSQRHYHKAFFFLTKCNLHKQTPLDDFILKGEKVQQHFGKKAGHACQMTFIRLFEYAYTLHANIL